MPLNVSSLVGSMRGAALGAFGDLWTDVKSFLLPELKKLALTIVGIEKGLFAQPPIYTKESVKILYRMQVNSLKAIITAMTALTLLAVQKALNAILAAVKTTVNSAVGFALV